MSNPYALLQTDPDLEKNKGIKLDYGDFRVSIRRAGGSNKRFGQMLTAKMKPHRFKLDHDALEEDVSLQIMIDTYIATVIFNWEVKDDNGGWVQGMFDPRADDKRIIEYDADNTAMVLREVPDLFRDIQSQANRLNNFLRAEREDDAGN